MAVIINNESIVPFLGERLKFIRGLDPLGLQNTSDATFSKLLPGLNNVTGRIRYYSFYAWILDMYSKKVGSTDPKDQRQFIRRAEYIIALLCQYYEGDKSSIPGSNYSSIEVNVNKAIRHNLQEATYKPDGSTRDTYWNYPAGAFGQYYLGSLRDIGIVIERDNHAGIYVRTAKRNNEYISGEELADAFSENINDAKQKLFLNCINTGFVTEKQLLQLLPEFNLALIPADSKEQDLLKQLLLQKDFPLRIEEYPSTLRKQTIKNILKYLSLNSDDFYDRAFVYHCYDEKGKVDERTDECLTGWYYYQMNEFWQYACTAIFNGTLSYLEKEVGPNWMPLNKLVEQVTKKVVVQFEKLKIAKSGDSTLNEVLEKLPKKESENDYLDLSSESDLTTKATYAFLIIFKIYVNNLSLLPELKTYSENNDLAKDGDSVTYFLNQFNSYKNKSLSKFIYDFIFLNIIYRHQYVAFRKIGSGTLSTQKFIIEDQHIRYLGNFDPGYTGPRIVRLIAFLKDLQIITAENSLTENGELFLNSLTNEND